jgi:hypothetical protein
MPAHRERRRTDLSLAVLASCLDLLSLHLQGSSSRRVCSIVGKSSRSSQNGRPEGACQGGRLAAVVGPQSMNANRISFYFSLSVD